MKNLPSLLAALCLGTAACTHTPTDQSAVSAPLGGDKAEPVGAPVSTDIRQMEERANWTANEEGPAAETDHSHWRPPDEFNIDSAPP